MRINTPGWNRLRYTLPSVLHLTLAVKPDPASCLRECARVLRPAGRIAIFDKFMAEDARPGVIRRAVNAVAVFLATDFDRRLGEILSEAQTPLVTTHDEPAAFGGYFRIVLLCKASGADKPK